MYAWVCVGVMSTHMRLRVCNSLALCLFFFFYYAHAVLLVVVVFILLISAAMVYESMVCGGWNWCRAR